MDHVEISFSRRSMMLFDTLLMTWPRLHARWERVQPLVVVPLRTVLDRVERAHDAIDAAPSFAVVRAAAEAWADGAAFAHVASCENPVTSLAGVPHLHSRLFDVYRRAERDGGRGGDHHVLVVVELATAPTGHELESALQALDVAELMRQVLTGDETIAQLTPRRFVVLAERAHADPLTIHTAATILRRDLPHDEGMPPRLWVEELPPDTDEVLAVLAVLMMA